MDEVAGAAALAAGAEPVDAELLECVAVPVVGSSGAATAEVARLSGRVVAGGRTLPFRMIRKRFRPLVDGQHASASREPAHWAYWRREPLAYGAGVLPRGPALAAPRCFGVGTDVVYLAEVAGPAESATVAARRLGVWQADTPIPQVPWLGGHQLAQRVGVSALDWSGVAVPDELPHAWDRRAELLAALERVPVVVSHGDFHLGNLIGGGAVTTVLDWAAFGAAPLGADLAHLALSAGTDLLDAYLTGLDGRFDAEMAALGYHVTLALVAASRVHWMRLRGVPVPQGYLDLTIAAVRGISRRRGR